MSSFEFSPEAQEDLWEIWHYIAIENHDVAAADRLWDDIENACETLGRLRTLVHPRKDLTPDPEVRFYCVREYYLIIFRKGSEPLQIARVLHGARDVEDELLQGDGSTLLRVGRLCIFQGSLAGSAPRAGWM